jgi:hypothetical protein
MKAPGIHCYVAGSIPAVTPRNCTKKIEKCSLEHQKTKEKKKRPAYKMIFWLKGTVWRELTGVESGTNR